MNNKIKQINVENIDWNKVKSLSDIVDIVFSITTPSADKANEVVDNIRMIVREYVKNNNLQSLVLGVSGGLDSSVIAALCQEKYTGVPLIGISIPMSSSTEHKEQAQWIGDNYCSVFEEFTGWDDEYFTSGEAEAYNCPTNVMNDVFETTTMTDKLAVKAGFKVDNFPKNVLQGNIKARLRMITLYDLARKTNGLVLSTDNLSEFQMGFWTLCGDVGNISPIQNIGKGFELPVIANVLNIRKDIITQAPSDGLMVTEENTDEAQLGGNYMEVDSIMNIYLNTLPVVAEVASQLRKSLFSLVENDIEGTKKVSKIISRYEALTFKRNGTVELQRDEIGI